MKIIRSKPNAAIFAQGAEAILSSGTCTAAIWCKNTPMLDGRTVGTIGACQLDHTPHAASFISACADILHHEYGCQTVVGPMNGNTWLQHRLVIESDGRPPFLMEPVEPPHFPALFEAAGFSILSRYSSSSIDLTKELENYPGITRRLENNGVTFRSISTSHFEDDLAAIFDLSLTSFSNNFLYTPITKQLFTGKYTSMRKHIDPDLVILAERNGALVGYVFCMPDLLAQQRGQQPAIIIKTLAAMPGRALSGIGTVLVAKAQQTAQQKGYTEAIHALQHENNNSLRISHRFNARVFRRYAIMAKSFF